jgi:hypothetical protein
MLGQHHPKDAADTAQAGYYRGFLELEKSELDARLVALTLRFTTCMAEEACLARAICTAEGMCMAESRAIRATEADLRAIDRMLKALERQFPDEEDRPSNA